MTLPRQSKIQNPKSKIHKRATYRKAGVDIQATDQWLARLQPVIRATHVPGVMPDRGQFAGLFRLAATKWQDPVLVSSTDGVGTKLKLAQLAGEHAGIGIDAVAMNTNDILVYGARPLFFLDYVAMGKVQPKILGALIRGVADGCRQSGCALLGGETAEMPGVYETNAYDIAGFCVGAVERRALLDGSAVRAGDAIVGLASSGLHANGFSLVRKVFSRAELARHTRELLTPTRIYVKPVLAVRRRHAISALAHVTGGGLTRRLASLVARRPGLKAEWAPGRWPIPPVFRLVQHAGGVSTDEMFATFNMGIGMALTCRAPDARAITAAFARRGVPAWLIGRIERSARR